jgi:hypothetical protein
MNISEENKQKIIEEINYVVPKLEDSTMHPVKRVYYQSAVHGVIYKVFNIEYDPNLIVLHNILQSTYQAFSTRIGRQMSGHDPSVELTEEFFQRLAQYFNELSRLMANDQAEGADVLPLIKKLSILTYATTGNGYYLYEKGTMPFVD